MADAFLLVLVVLTGLTGGVLGGLFGVGGGLLMVPLLLFALPDLAFKEAKAASLLAITFVSAVAILAHRRRRSVDFRRGILLGVGGVTGAVLSVRVAETLADRTLTLAFAVLLVAVGVRFLLAFEPRPHAVGRPKETAVALLAGFAAGLVSGFFGIGGGVVMVPTLVVLGTGMHLAVGTSLVAVGTNAFVATLTHLTLGYLPVFLALGLPLALGAVPGAEIGARLAHRLSAARLRRAFGGFLVAVGLWLGWGAWA